MKCLKCDQPIKQYYTQFPNYCKDCIDHHVASMKKEGNTTSIALELQQVPEELPTEKKTWFKVTVVILRAVFIQFPVTMAKLCYHMFATDEKKSVKRR